MNDRAYAAIEAEVKAEPQDALALKGIAAPVRAYSILGLTASDAGV